MPKIPQGRIQQLFREVDCAASKVARGKLLELATRLLFGAVPGVLVADSNSKNAANTEEIDITFWNERRRLGLYFLETPFLTECKNWKGRYPGKKSCTLQIRCAVG